MQKLLGVKSMPTAWVIRRSDTPIPVFKFYSVLLLIQTLLALPKTNSD